MPHVEFDIHTTLSPDDVVGMLTDFSPNRPKIWPGLWEGAYEVYRVDDTTAEIREGNRKPKVWARERYDWSKPGLVRWEVLESNFSKPGSFVQLEAKPSAQGGSELHVTWHRQGSTLLGRVAGRIIVLSKGAPVRSSLAAGLKRAEAGAAKP